MHHKKSGSLLIIALVFALLFSPAANAIENRTDSEKNVDVTLVADTTQVTGGQSVTIAIIENIAPHWHTYWVNPGDSGEPTRISWDGLEGLKFEPIQWATPSKIPFPPLLNYGYEGKVTLLQNITFPEDIPSGPITLNAQVSLLACEEICIPEISKHSLTFNAGEFGDPSVIAQAQSHMPLQMTWAAEYHKNGNDIKFTIDGIKPSYISDINSVELFPIEQGLIANAEKPTVQWNDSALKYSQAAGEIKITSIPSTDLIVAYNDPSGARKSVQLNAKSTAEQTAEIDAGFTDDIPAADQGIKQQPKLGFFSAIFAALLGGLILNLMPCVFPVLSLKALKLVQLQDKDEAKARTQGLSYTAGVIISFLSLAGILIALQAAGAQIGWGFQLQNPIVIGVLIYLIFTLGLNLAGMFDIRAGRFANFGSKLTENDGAKGSFFTGVLATAVATPCTAPFMGAAMAYALAQSPAISLSIFFMLGFGLALPYLLLCYIPALRQMLPKPGAWMDTFKQFLAFPMFATAAWLVWVLAQQTGHAGILNILMGAVILSLGIWTFTKGKRPLAEIILLLAFIPLVTLKPSPYTGSVPQEIVKSQNWDSFSQEKLDMALNETDEPVFVNMTAAWCITCKVNERIALNTSDTKMLFSEKHIQYFKGDWTNSDAQITSFLQRYGRQGVPLYVYYASRDAITGQRPDAVILPQLLTPKIIRDTLN